jgi:hypothetical protein
MEFKGSQVVGLIIVCEYFISLKPLVNHFKKEDREPTKIRPVKDRWSR